LIQTSEDKPMPVPQDWKAAAVAITPGFEVAGDPYQGVSGNFDGMGISCGALQWNIGKGSLQPMVKAVGQPAVLAAMPTCGAQLCQACHSTVSAGLAIVNSWQTGSKLKPVAKAELRALMGSPAMKAQQNARIDAVAATANSRATAWATTRPAGPVTKRLFCWFFDLTTQNGGLAGMTYKAVADFIALNSPDLADDFICDFLAGQTGASGHIKDANRNAALWRNTASAEKLELLVMTYLRSGSSLPQWRHVVINRKGSIAMGGGWVNGNLYDFAAHGL